MASAIQIAAVNARKKRQKKDGEKAGRFNLRGMTTGIAQGMKGIVKEEVQAEAKREISEMVYYLIFLFLFTLVTVSGSNNQMVHWVGANVLDAFVTEPLPIEEMDVKMTYEDVGTVEEMFLFMKGPMYELLYTAESFDGDDSTADLVELVNSGNNSDIDPTYAARFPPKGEFLGSLTLVGGVRIGQLRVNPVSCNIPPHIKMDHPVCIPEFHVDHESVDPFTFDDHTWNFSRQSKEPFYSGEGSIDVSYPEPGFAVVLPRVENCEDPDNLTTCEVYQMIEDMEEFKFVDKLTRAVTIDMTFFHPRMGYFVLLRLVFQLPSTGGMMPISQVMVTRLYEYATSDDWIRFGMEIVVLLFVLWWLIHEILTIKRGPKKYLKDFTNYPHLLNLLLFIAATMYKIKAQMSLPSEIDVLTDDYIPLRKSARESLLYKKVNSFNAFLCFMKVFKYLGFIPKFAQLNRTLGKASGSISGFGFMFAIVLYGSSLAYMMAFGGASSDYRNITSSLYSLIRSLLGDFDFEELRRADSFLAPIFFSIFIILSVFVLLNMFIAIITDAYTETKEELAKEQDVGLDTLTKEIYNYLLYHILFRIPIVGPILRRIYEQAQKTAMMAAKHGERFAANAVGRLDRETGQFLEAEKAHDKKEAADIVSYIGMRSSETRGIQIRDEFGMIRKDIDPDILLNWAATRIQAIYRGRKARQQAKNQISRVNNPREPETSKAVDLGISTVDRVELSPAPRPSTSLSPMSKEDEDSHVTIEMEEIHFPKGKKKTPHGGPSYGVIDQSEEGSQISNDSQDSDQGDILLRLF